MISTALVVGFVGMSFLSALALFAACVMVGRTAPENAQVAIPAHVRAASRKQQSAIVDVEWRMVNDQVAA